MNKFIQLAQQGVYKLQFRKTQASSRRRGRRRREPLTVFQRLLFDLVKKVDAISPRKVPVLFVDFSRLQTQFALWVFSVLFVHLATLSVSSSSRSSSCRCMRSREWTQPKRRVYHEAFITIGIGRLPWVSKWVILNCERALALWPYRKTDLMTHVFG